MSTSEALFTLLWSLIQLFGSLCCFFVAFDYLRLLRRNRRVERKIQEFYNEENEMSEPVYQILQIADMLEIELEKDS